MSTGASSCRYVFDYSYNNGEATGTYHAYCNNANANDVALNHPGDPGMINPQSISSFDGDGEFTINQQAEGPFLTAKALNCDSPASEC